MKKQEANCDKSLGGLLSRSVVLHSAAKPHLIGLNALVDPACYNRRRDWQIDTCICDIRTDDPM